MREYEFINGIRELPERICVETLFVSREMAKLRNLECVDLGLTDSDPIMETNVSNSSPVTNMPLVVLKSMVDADVMTDSPNPVRDRILQTETETKTIAIQCDLSKEEADLEFNKYFTESKSVVVTNKNFQAEIQRFQTFINNSTDFYSNGMIECLLCGEIKPNAKLMESHMSIHWGPKKLCFRCGICFEHKVLWKQHSCAQKRSTELKYIKCPHHLCAASVISPLELYDHLNEHCDTSIHKCTACEKSFPTIDELRSHFKIHKSCNKTAQKVRPSDIYRIPIEDTKYRKRIKILRTPTGKQLLVKSYLSQIALKRISTRSYYCNICLRRCRSFSQYQFHMKRCLEVYRRRLKCKRVNIAVNLMLMNGISNGHK